MHDPQTINGYLQCNGRSQALPFIDPQFLKREGKQKLESPLMPKKPELSAKSY